MDISFLVDTTMLNEDDVTNVLQSMQNRVGLGTWTPSNSKPGQFGKFKIASLEFFK